MTNQTMNLVTLSANAGTVHVPEIVLYWDSTYGGESWRTNMSYSYVGDHWNDQISSIIVVSGVWEFFEHKDFGGAKWTYGPGYYPNVPNDIISSFRGVAY